MFSNFFQSKSPSISKSLIQLKNVLKRKRKNSPKKNLSSDERLLIKEITEKTMEWNKNNITRTKAYLDYYLSHPELHWALLAHMVSRNAGWNMTDLKGEFLSKILSNKDRNAYFTFIERANWLIFQDAYPQLLIYEESQKRGQNLFYLLPYFHISIFMESVWNQYWKEQDSFLITAALIINEQNYIESRVIRNQEFQEAVISTLEFTFQDFLSLNHILFPFMDEQKIKLKGLTVHQFEKLQDRIRLGKQLYSVLFSNQEQLGMVVQWAMKHQHTGSRKDYWPHFFHEIYEGVPGKLVKPRIDSCKLKPGSARIYSPKLEFAWENIQHKPAEIYEWFQDWRIIYFLNNSGDQVEGLIEEAYCRTIKMLELAAFTKKVIF